MSYSNKTREELIMICKEKSIKGYSKKKKDDILKLLHDSDLHVNDSNVNDSNVNDSNVNDSNVNVIDLFCGCGGMSKGLVDAGFNVIAGIDIWDKAIDSYKKNFHHEAICKDLTTFSPENFRSLYNKKIDLIVGGPPCQGFSIAGKRDTTDPRNSLFMEYVKYINYFKPKTIMMENVMGILSMKTDKKEKVIDIILDQLNVNYNCIITKLYTSDFEVPQNRRRIIIIGIRKDLGIMPTAPKQVLTVENRIPVKNDSITKR